MSRIGTLLANASLHNLNESFTLFFGNDSSGYSRQTADGGGGDVEDGRDFIVEDGSEDDVEEMEEEEEKDGEFSDIFE